MAPIHNGKRLWYLYSNKDYNPLTTFAHSYHTPQIVQPNQPHTSIGQQLAAINPLKKLDRYIIGKFYRTFLFCIFLFALISCVIDYSEKVDNIVQKKAPLVEVLIYYQNFIPHITALLFPLFIFIATIFFTSMMAYKSEVIAILCSGVSFQRYLLPYFVGGGFLCLISLYANHYIIPNANRLRVAFEDKYINDGNFAYPGENVHLALSKEKFIYIQSFNFNSGIGNHFTAETIKGTLLTEKIMAEVITYDSLKNKWVLKDIIIRRNNGLKEQLIRVPEMTLSYPFVPADLRRNEAIKEALTTPQLKQFIATESLRGRDNLNFFYVELYRRSAQPVAGLILIIMGVCIASRKIRGGSGLHLALGIAISAIYIMFMQFFGTFSTKAAFSPLLATWIPNFIFGGITYYLYRKQAS